MAKQDPRSPRRNYNTSPIFNNRPLAHSPILSYDLLMKNPERSECDNLALQAEQLDFATQRELLDMYQHRALGKEAETTSRGDE